MFEQVYESLRKATEANMQTQQEMFRKMFTMWPGMPFPMTTPADQIQQFQRKWAEAVGDTLKRQRELIEVQFKAGIENLEKAFQIAGSKNPEELRAKTLELWQKCFENLRQAYEAQVREFQAAMSKWVEVVSRGAA
jgi:molecular chaperone DnaK (HSP70)